MVMIVRDENTLPVILRKEMVVYVVNYTRQTPYFSGFRLSIDYRATYVYVSSSTIYGISDNIKTLEKCRINNYNVCISDSENFMGALAPGAPMLPIPVAFFIMSTLVLCEVWSYAISTQQLFTL